MARTAPSLIPACTLMAVLTAAAANPLTMRETCEAGVIPDQVRVADCGLAKAIASGLERSETLRKEVDRVGHLKGIVYLESRYFVQPRTRAVLSGALLHTVSQAGSRRILRVIVAPESGDRPILVVAHELQHAIEVLESDAMTEADIDQLFERIGTPAATGIVETQAALDVERTVGRELKLMRGAPASCCPALDARDSARLSRLQGTFPD